jgi:hypothetical protein
MRTALAGLLAFLSLAVVFAWSARAGEGKSVEERLASVEKRLAAIEAKINAVEVWDKNRSIAEAQMANFASAIQQYKAVNKKLPESLQDLTRKAEKDSEPFMDSIPKDPWGQPYEYRPNGNRDFTIRSHGEDTEPDTADDLVWPREDR